MATQVNSTAIRDKSVVVDFEKSNLASGEFLNFIATKLEDTSVRKFQREFVIGIPDVQFYEILAVRLNVPLSKDVIQERSITDGEAREYYTIEYLVDSLFLELAATREIVVTSDGRKVMFRKYYNQAFRLQRWIPIAKPVPEFIVNLVDLTPRIAIELKTLDKFDYNYVIRQAVGRIFENIDFKSYHMNIARGVKVRLDR